MKGHFSILIDANLYQWRALSYAAISVCGLVGMLVFEGWANLVMLLFTAWPVLVGCLARLKMRSETRNLTK